MRNLALGTLVAGMLLLGCAHRQHLAAAPSPEVKPYVRVRTANNSNVLELQIALRQFKPATNGPAIWLSAVSHLGEKSYYEGLQEHLARRTLVLFEGIQGGAGKVAQEKSDLSGLQAELARSLGLVFQMDAIDYQRENFRNSDLSVPEIRELLASRAANGTRSEAGGDFDLLMQLMRGESDLSGPITYVLKLVGGHEGLQGLGRLALLELLGAIGGDPGKISAMPESMKQLEEVLLEGRNQAVLRDLVATLPRLETDQSVSMFYGAAHMADLERRLRDHLGYQPSREVWLTAFSVDIQRSGITNSQREFIREFVRAQLLSK